MFMYINSRLRKVDGSQGMLSERDKLRGAENATLPETGLNENNSEHTQVLKILKTENWTSSYIYRE